jgi:hypothetical protein
MFNNTNLSSTSVTKPFSTLPFEDKIKVISETLSKEGRDFLKSQLSEEERNKWKKQRKEEKLKKED